ncbi:MAG: hypothetical protein O2871_01225 [bacterium]|nr:hypothetical protein [bacterium]
MDTKFTHFRLYTKSTRFFNIILDKRGRFILSSLIQMILFYLFRDYLYHPFYFFVFILGTFLIQLITLWSSEVKSKLWVYLFGIFLNVSLVLFYSVYPQLKPSLKVAYSLILGSFNYVFLVTSNVFLVTFERGRKIPLIRASLTLNSILNLFILFFFYLASIKLWPNVLIQSSLIFFSTFAVSWYYLYVNNIEIERNKNFVLESFLISVLITQTFFVLIFKQLNFFYIALLLTIATYTLNDYMKHYLNYSLKKQIIISYVFINLVVYTIAILSNQSL